MKVDMILILQMQKTTRFMYTLKIIDIEDEQTQDRTLAPLAINDTTINYGHNIGNSIPY